MLQQIRKLFTQMHHGSNVEVHTETDVRIISAALLVEIATADQKIDQRERSTLIALLQRHYQLDLKSAQELVEHALEARQNATSLYEFTQIVNEQFNQQNKYTLVLQMWQVAFADGDIGALEEHLIRRVAELIYLPHGLFTRARAEAREGVEGLNSP